MIRHLASRVQVGSPVTMRLLHLPSQLEKGNNSLNSLPFTLKEQSVTLCLCMLGLEKVPLVWEDDMQMRSKFLDNKVTNNVFI